MATFEVKVVAIDAIEEHPNADAIEIAVIGGYRSIVKKHTVAAGDLVVYIPEASVLPEWLLKEMGFWDREKGKGTLAGKQGNRVKIAKLRGVISQGIIYPVDKITHTGDLHWVMFYTDETLDPNNDTVVLDEDVMDRLGIIKYEPVIPTHMQGEVCSLMGYTPKYDIENIQKWPDVFEEGEDVVFTEKLHGTWTCFGYAPKADHAELLDNSSIISSKGLSDKGLAFKYWEEDGTPLNVSNLYVKTFRETMLSTAYEFDGRSRWEILMEYANEWAHSSVYLLGEIFGPGIQDLHYGLKKKEFRLFDMYVGKPGEGTFASYEVLQDVARRLDLPLVPTLYEGPFSMDIVEQHRDGATTVSEGSHMREGIVIKPMEESRHDDLGRVVLKAVSPDYLLRKNKNATEFN